MFIELKVGLKENSQWIIINTDHILAIPHKGGNNKPPDMIVMSDRQSIADIQHPTYQEIKDLLCERNN